MMLVNATFYIVVIHVFDDSVEGLVIGLVRIAKFNG